MYPFIHDNSSSTRKFIRSHVMRGKNARKRQPKPPFGSWINNLVGEESIKSTRKKEEPQIALPRSVCSELQMTSFADSTQPYMLDLIYKFFTVLKQSHPIEICVDFDSASSAWYGYLLSEALYLHSVLWTTQAYFDWIQGIGISEKALVHESKAITLLQERLNYPQNAVSDATMAVVVNFVLTTALVGQFSTARKHMMGLCQILKLRGGLGQLKGNSQLQIKICRADLSLALLNGARPLLLSEEIYWKPFIADPSDSELLTRHFPGFALDRRLMNTSADLRKFCNSATIAFLTDSKIDREIFQETLISVQYRLMALKFSNGDSNDKEEEEEEEGETLNETIRLALLAFSNTIFCQMRGIKVRFSNLSEQVKDVLLSPVVRADLRKLTTVSLWVLFVAAIAAVTDEDDAWLIPLIKERLSQGGTFLSWYTVQSILKDFIWIDKLHDETGKAVYSRAIR